MNPKYLILTEGFTNPHVAKTARNVLLYRPESVIALLDKYNRDRISRELLNAGGVPVVADFNDAPAADTLLIGIATPGGVLPQKLRYRIFEAIERKMNIVSGLHHFLSDDPEISSKALEAGIKINDIRKTDFTGVAHRKGINPKCLRIETVGNDCSVGKMIVCLEVQKYLLEKGYNAGFAATGQTGIIIAGKGIPVDAVRGDYISGSAEKLVLENQHHDFLFIEGQGSLAHPRYSAVSIGLLHGAMPQGLIMCYEMGREFIHGLDGVKIPPLRDVINLYECNAANLFKTKVIGIAINSRKHNEKDAAAERAGIKKLTGLPACDVIRDGPEELGEAVLSYSRKLR